MAELTQEKVYVADLLEGMFVSRLDRPWVGTPFPLQGFRIRDQSEIRLLGAYCRYVYVDVVKSQVRVERRDAPSAAPAPKRRSGRYLLNPDRTEYPEPSRDFTREIPVAKRLHRDVTQALEQITARLAAGQPADLAPAGKAARRMIDSVVRNPDAALWIARMRRQDGHTYARCVRSSILAIAFGRHLGLDRARLERVALGVLLSEVGFTRLPTALLTGSGSGGADPELLRSHVAHGIEILRALKAHEEVVETLATHHERHDGSGYPEGLKGQRIPLGGRIAGIVDVYDALTSPREGEAAAPPTALAMLHRMREREFDAALVDEFIQAIGIYPAGTLVELSTGEVGIVVAQRAERRLRPRVLLVLDADKVPLARRREIDLLANRRDQAGRPLEIVRALPAGSHGIGLIPPARGGVVARLLGRGRGWLG